ncbi:MAG TPA: hypothetical protein VKD72_31410 [Gemmataceae bacterium]|nr:hypothetical protein [Gemmataceae bacterium]
MQARSESISPENGADGKNAKPALPQLVVPGELLKQRNAVIAVVVVVELVVVVVGVHTGSPGCPVQVQVPTLHWSRIDDLQALRAMLDKPAHPAVISAEHCFEPQIDGAAFAPETKTPAAKSTTAANVTATFLVIVIVEFPGGPFRGRPRCTTSIQRATYAAA